MTTHAPAPPGKIKPFDVDEVFARLRDAVRPYKMAALFELAEEGHNSVFEVLAGCIISIRTLDEVTLTTAKRLFATARTPAQIAKLTPTQIDDLIRTCTFHEAKAHQLHAIAALAVRDYGGDLPADFPTLTSLRGVGPKCANLVLGIAANQPHGIAVDIHVHRVTTRWGLAHATTPEATRQQLEQRLPPERWVVLNKLLVPFGKHICTAKLPKCSTCPLLPYCDQVDVTKHR